MSFQLEALRDKPLGWWQLDDTTPYQDYSGYNRAGTQAGTQVKHAALANGCAYAPVFSKGAEGSFTVPVFEQGKESNPFSLEAVIRPIIKTVGYEVQAYRENKHPNPRASSLTGWTGVNGTISLVDGNTAIRLVANAGAPWTVASGAGIQNLTGQTHLTVSADVRSNLSTVNIQLTNRAADNTNLGNAGAQVTDVPPNTWVRRRFVVTLKANVAYTADLQMIAGIGASDYLEFRRIVVEFGDQPIASYFDGDVPGYEWTGTPSNSISRTRADVSVVNLLPNPSFELDSANTGNWAGTGGVATLTRNTDGGYIGSAYMRTTQTTASTSSGDVSTALPINVLSDGEVISGAIYGRANTARQLRAGIQWHNATGGIVTSTVGGLVNAPANTWVRLVIENQVVPVGAVRCKIVVQSSTSMAVGDTLDLDAAILNRGATALPYFDGSSDGARWSGTPHASYSLMLISDGEQQILGNDGQYDGLTIEGTTVHFKTKYSDGEVIDASYDLREHRRVHVVGVHTSAKNSLYVDGELVAEANILEPSTYSITTPNLTSGNSNSSGALAVNGIGVYNYALNSQAVSRHAMHSRYAMSADTVAEGFGGMRIPLATALRTTLFSTTFDSYDEWDDGKLSNLTIENNALVQNETNNTGSWHNAIALDPVPATSIEGVRFSWTGHGVVLDVSLDGDTWERVEQGKMPALITSGFNPTGKSLLIRASMPSHDGDESYRLDSLTVEIVGAGPYRYSGRDITLSAKVKVEDERPPFEMRDSWGVTFDGTNSLTISPSSDGTSPKVIEMWVKNTGEDTTSRYLLDVRDTVNTTSSIGYIYYDATARRYEHSGTLYINGVVQTFGLANFPLNEWVLVHLVVPGTVSTTISVAQRYSGGSRGKWQVGSVALYNTTMNAATINNIYRSYLGQPTLRVDDTNAIVVTEPANAGSIYVHDWSIQSAG